MQIVSNRLVNLTHEALCYHGAVPYIDQTGLQSTHLARLNFETLAHIPAYFNC